jgi:hypothetical protein
MEFKICYCCKRNYPLFMFHKAVRFTIKTDLGRNRCCRICVFKEAKHPVVRWDTSAKDFGIIQMTLKQRIKEFFN